MKDMDQIERGMTMKSRKWLWACMLGAALTAAGIMSVSAADHVVSSVTIRLKAGARRFTSGYWTGKQRCRGRKYIYFLFHG